MNYRYFIGSENDFKLTLSLSQCANSSQELECLLPARAENPVIAPDAEEVDLTDFDRSQGSGGGGRREAYNDSSDEEGGHHGPGVQCAHQ